MSIRTHRVGEQIKRELALMLTREEIHEPLVDNRVSISAVEMSRDLQYATIFFSSLGGNNDAILVSLTRASGFIRGRLGQRLRLRFVPHLRFVVDDSMIYGDKIERLLSSLEIPKEEPNADDPHPSNEEFPL
ncbi:MAG: 30S ribosome-binding factor RbfA [Magnetococcus sp. DMHC-6]